MSNKTGPPASGDDRMDTSYLTQQVANIIAQLHGLFDEIGVDAKERDRRESEVFAALSDTLHNQVKQVAGERQSLVDEAGNLKNGVNQLIQALGDEKDLSADDNLELTYPLRDCIRRLREKYQYAQKLHMERFEQIKKLVIAFHSYSSHLEPSFVAIKLPPNLSNPATAEKAISNNCPPTFSLSSSYIAELDTEFTRVYEEYHKRISKVQQTAQDIISLWAELGTPDGQTDRRIVEHASDSPEQLGLRKEDIKQLSNRKERLIAEQKNRQAKIEGYFSQINTLWQRLEVDVSERKSFMAVNRGVGLQVIKNCEDELARLEELKKRNMGLFIEDARCRLQGLWDELYYSEEDMLAFTPAWTDEYSDALLAAHEAEIHRLQNLINQRKPLLALISQHQSLLSDKDELEQSSQDASRLITRGQRGERRDPGKLLREEKMRKRIARELPKVAQELRALLGKWEDEQGTPFTVHGEAYINKLEPQQKPELRRGGAASSMGLRTQKSFMGGNSTIIGGIDGGTLRGAKSTNNFSMSVRQPSPTRTNVAAPSRSKTPTFGASTRPAGGANQSMMQPAGTVRGHSRTQTAHEIGGKAATVSPSRIPGRAPLAALRDLNTSQMQPGRPVPGSPSRIGKPALAGTLRSPPKMKDLFLPPSPSRIGAPGGVSTLRQHAEAKNGVPLGSLVTSQTPEDVYGGEGSPSRLRLQHYPMTAGKGMQPNYASSVSTGTWSQLSVSTPRMDSSFSSQSNLSNSWQDRQGSHKRFEQDPAAAAALAAVTGGAGARQASASSNVTSTSAGSIGASALVGSENWETYGGDEDEERTPQSAAAAATAATAADPELSAYQQQQERYYAKLHEQRRSKLIPPEKLHPSGVDWMREGQQQQMGQLTDALAETRIGETF